MISFTEKKTKSNLCAILLVINVLRNRKPCFVLIGQIRDVVLSGFGLKSCASLGVRSGASVFFVRFFLPAITGSVRIGPDTTGETNERLKLEWFTFFKCLFRCFRR